MEFVYCVNATRAHVNYAVNDATPADLNSPINVSYVPVKTYASLNSHVPMNSWTHMNSWTPMNSGINLLAGMEFGKIIYNNNPLIDQLDNCIDNLIKLRNALI